MSIDDTVNNVPEVKAKLPEKRKHTNPFYSPLANLTLAAALLFTSAVAAPKARADGYDPKDKIGTELVQSEIDLSQYTKVAEQDGLEVYISEISLKPRHDPNKKTNPDWKKSNCVRFYDLLISNNNDFGYKILELSATAYYNDGSTTSHKFDAEKFSQTWGTNYIKLKSYLLEKDRWTSEFNCDFPVRLVEKYKLLSDQGKKITLTVETSIK